MDIQEKLKTPIQSYKSFSDWDTEYTAQYLKTHRKSEADLISDKYYNTIRNQTWGQFVAVKNGEEPKLISLHSDEYWNSREAIEKSMEVIHAGKTPDQIIQESMNATKENLDAEAQSQKKESSSRIRAMKDFFDGCNPRKSHTLK